MKANGAYATCVLPHNTPVFPNQTLAQLLPQNAAGIVFKPYPKHLFEAYQHLLISTDVRPDGAYMKSCPKLLAASHTKPIQSLVKPYLFEAAKEMQGNSTNVH